MEARIVRVALAAAATVIVCASHAIFLIDPVNAAGYRTRNFTVDAPTPRLAKEIGDAAENYRRTLAMDWLGKELPNWSKPCPIKARVAPTLGAGGATSFVFDRGEVFGWRMDIQGSRERILDSVVPHEVTHTIFATHFRQPIPRWADEGACTTVEHRSEIAKQEQLLLTFLQTRRGIPFNFMFAMTEYPEDVLPLYAQGHALARFLIDQRGKREFLTFLEDGLTDGNWIRAVRQRYGYQNLQALQDSWQNWIVQGRPQLQLAADAKTDTVLVASYDAPKRQQPMQLAAANAGGRAPAVTPTPRVPAEGTPVAAANVPSSSAASIQPGTATASRPLTSVYDAASRNWQ